MSYTNEDGIEFENSEEERHFTQSRRLSGFHVAVVKAFYPEEAYQSIMGSNWNQPEPHGRGTMGNWGMALRYATIDPWYAEYGLSKGKFEQAEIDRFAKTWYSTAFAELPVGPEVLLEFWRKNRKESQEAKVANKRKRERRRARKFEREFDAERQPDSVYRRLRKSIPNPNAVDEQMLKNLSRLIAQSNDALWQAEQMKDNDGEVPLGDLQDYAKLLDLSVKLGKQSLDLLKQHGYDFQARRRRREAQTAAEIVDETVEEFAAYFDEMCHIMICPNCDMELASVARNFPTRQYTLTIPKCPRCEHPVRVVLEALEDEVMDA